MINNRKLFFLGIILITAGISIVVTGGTMYFLLVSSSANKLRQSIGINDSNIITHTTVQTDKVVLEESSKIIDASKSAGKSVVSITGEGQATSDVFGFGTIAPKTAGTGFIMTSDGLIATNKHVVSDSKADYTVLTNDGKKYTAKVLALDPVQDLAVIKIQSDKKFQPVILGNSSGIQIGQTAIAIGNALGQFSNTVSVGVISGLQRTISASDQVGGFSETLEGIIQTDAAINSGNSGGPLLNLKGEVIGIDTAMAQGAQDIGFAIPIDMAKKDIDQVVKTNKIVYPFLGIRYVLVNAQVKEKYNLSVDYGVLVLKGSKGEAAVTAGSAADKAGIKEKDVVLEIAGQKITKDKTLANQIMNFNPGDKVTLKILHDGKEINVDVVLGERPQ